MRILAKVIIILMAISFINFNCPIFAMNNKTTTKNTSIVSIKKTTAKKKLTKKQKAKLKAKKEKEKGKKIVQTARKYVGKLPYAYGGASLKTGSDCCGFTMCIYAANKIKIGRTVETQAQQGRSIPLSQIIPGDIVIYWGHVGIYSGKGKIIHSPTPGQYVSETSMFIMYIRDIRRIGG